MMKLATIEAMFPELKGPHIYKIGRGRGSNKSVAVARGFRDLMGQLNRKRYQTIKATITLVDVPKDGI